MRGNKEMGMGMGRGGWEVQRSICRRGGRGLGLVGMWLNRSRCRCRRLGRSGRVGVWDFSLLVVETVILRLLGSLLECVKWPGGGGSVTCGRSGRCGPKLCLVYLLVYNNIRGYGCPAIPLVDFVIRI